MRYDLLKESLPKSSLEDKAYYIGSCRNAMIARWFEEEQCFKHWRTKFSYCFIEKIKHPEDEDQFDVFIPIRQATDEEIGFLINQRGEIL